MKNQVKYIRTVVMLVICSLLLASCCTTADGRLTLITSKQCVVEKSQPEADAAESAGICQRHPFVCMVVGGLIVAGVYGLSTQSSTPHAQKQLY